MHYCLISWRPIAMPLIHFILFHPYIQTTSAPFSCTVQAGKWMLIFSTLVCFLTLPCQSRCVGKPRFSAFFYSDSCFSNSTFELSAAEFLWASILSIYAIGIERHVPWCESVCWWPNKGAFWFVSSSTSSFSVKNTASPLDRCLSRRVARCDKGNEHAKWTGNESAVAEMNHLIARARNAQTSYNDALFRHSSPTVSDNVITSVGNTDSHIQSCTSNSYLTWAQRKQLCCFFLVFRLEPIACGFQFFRTDFVVGDDQKRSFISPSLINFIFLDDFLIYWGVWCFVSLVQTIDLKKFVKKGISCCLFVFTFESKS